MQLPLQQLLAALLLLCCLSVLVPCEAQSATACGGLCAILPEEGGCACDSSCKCPGGLRGTVTQQSCMVFQQRFNCSLSIVIGWFRMWLHGGW